MATIVHPVESDVAAVHADLPKVTSFVEKILSTGSPLEVAQKASAAYLALMLAFQRRNILEVEFAPRLILDIGDRGFEIRLHGSMRTSESAIDLAVQPESSNSMGISHASGDGDSRDKHHLDHRLPAYKMNIDRLLAALPNHRVSADFFDSLDTPPLETGENARALTEAKQAVPAIAHQMSRLDQLESKARILSVQTNVAYWHLGAIAYSGVDINAIIHDRTTQGALLDVLCAASADAEDRKTLRARYQKRLIRAKKFLILVRTFGQAILACAPDVCVTKIDGLRLADLVGMARGSVERAKVESFRTRFQDRMVESQ